MPSTERSTGGRIAMALFWILVVLELAGMGLAGVSKFQGDGWMGMFEGWGYPAWFALVIGGTELGGAVLLLVPRLASYSAAVLIGVMLGAIWTVIGQTTQTGLGPGLPLIHIAVLSIILGVRWKRRWRPSGPPAPDASVAHA